MDAKRYWAFISYRHTDRAVVRWLHAALETYVVPRRIVGRPTPMGPAPRRLRPIFRDRDDLSADPNLRARILEALEASAFLIVVCSPAAARSTWVNEEVLRFKALHGESRVLAVIVAGSPHASATPGQEDEECFPPALRVRMGDAGILTEERADPVAADLRPNGDGRRLTRLKLLAPILGVGLDDLARRDAHRRQVQLGALAGGLGALALAMTGLAAAALMARDEARHQRGEAETLVEFMLTDLRKKLEPEGRLDVLASVGQQAMDYYGRQARHGMDADALGRKARVLHMLGEIDETKGDMTSAAHLFEQAAATTAELLSREPTNLRRIFEHAQSVFWLGDIADRRGDIATSEANFQNYERLVQSLVRAQPANLDYQGELDDAYSNLGTELYKQGRFSEALSAFSAALEISRSLAKRLPADRDRRWDLAQSYSWVSDAEVALGRLPQGIADRMSERAIFLSMLANDPNDNAAADELVNNRIRLARIFNAEQRLSDAIGELRLALVSSDRLIAYEPANMTLRQHRALALEGLAEIDLRRGNSKVAQDLARAADLEAEALVRRDQTVAGWQGPILGGARIVAIKASADMATTRDLLRLALAPAVAEAVRLAALSDRHAGDQTLASLAAEARLLAGDYYSASGKRLAALAEWQAAVSRLESLGFEQPNYDGQLGRVVLSQSRRRLNVAKSVALAGEKNSVAHFSDQGDSHATGQYRW